MLTLRIVLTPDTAPNRIVMIKVQDLNAAKAYVRGIGENVYRASLWHQYSHYSSYRTHIYLKGQGWKECGQYD